MGLYWSLWALWVLMGPYASSWVNVGLCRSFGVLMGLYGFLYKLMRPFVSLWDLIGPYASFWVHMRPNRSLGVLMDSNVSL